MCYRPRFEQMAPYLYPKGREEPLSIDDTVLTVAFLSPTMVPFNSPAIISAVNCILFRF